MWATLYEHRLDYYKERPTKGNDTVLGFLTVKASAECDPFDKESSGGFFASSSVYGFKLSDGSLTVSFSASTEDDRAMWVNSIRDAIEGIRHMRPNGPRGEDERSKTVSKRISAAREGMTAIMELPRKVGELSKKPIVGRFGLKSPKTRFFKDR